MKKLAIVFALFIFSCKENQKLNWKEMVISGHDTILFDNGNTDLTKCHGEIWGHSDTLNHTFVTTIKSRDTVFITKIKYDTVYTSLKINSANTVNIGQ